MAEPLVQVMVAVGVAVGGVIGGIVLAIRRSTKLAPVSNGYVHPSMCRDLIASVHAMEVQQAVNVERLTNVIAEVRVLVDRVSRLEDR